MAFKMKGWSAFTKKTDKKLMTGAAEGAAEAASEKLMNKWAKLGRKEASESGNYIPQTKQPVKEARPQSLKPKKEKMLTGAAEGAAEFMSSRKSNLHEKKFKPRRSVQEAKKSPMPKRKKKFFTKTESDRTRGTMGGPHVEKVGKTKGAMGKSKVFKATTTRDRSEPGGYKTEYTKTVTGEKRKEKPISKKKFERKQKRYSGKKNVKDLTAKPYDWKGEFEKAGFKAAKLGGK